MYPQVYLSGVVRLREEDGDTRYRLQLMPEAEAKLAALVRAGGASPLRHRPDGDGTARWTTEALFKETKALPRRTMAERAGQLVTVTARIRRYRFATTTGVAEGWTLTAVALKDYSA